MATRHVVLLALVAALVGAGPAGADDLSGSELFLCSATEVRACPVDDDCYYARPDELNMPQFVEVNLREKMLKTTQASGENRKTPIRTLERADGLILLQGAENGRAFSFVIVEETGQVSIAVARKGVSVAVFGACTPLPSR